MVTQIRYSRSCRLEEPSHSFHSTSAYRRHMAISPFPLGTDSANTLYAPEGGDSSQAPNAFRRSTFARGRSSKVQMTHPSGIRIYVPPALRDPGLRNSHSASAHSVSSELPKCPLFPCQLRAGWVSPAVFLDLHSLIGIRPKRC